MDSPVVLSPPVTGSSDSILAPPIIPPMILKSFHTSTYASPVSLQSLIHSQEQNKKCSSNVSAVTSPMVVDTQINSAIQVQTLAQTVQRMPLPTSGFVVVGPTAFTSRSCGVPINCSQQLPMPVVGTAKTKQLLPFTARQIVSSPKKRFRKLSVLKDTSVPKRKRGRPRRSASVTVASNSVTPRLILPRVAERVPLIALASQHMEKQPSITNESCSNRVPYITSLTFPHSNTSKHITASAKQYNLSNRQVNIVSFSTHENANQHLREPVTVNPQSHVPGNVLDKLTATPVTNSRSITNSTSDNKSGSCSMIANVAFVESVRDLHQAEVDKINSKKELPVSSDSDPNHKITGCSETYQNDGLIQAALPKPLVINSSPQLQPVYETNSSQPFSVITISSCSQLPTSVPDKSCHTSVANASSTVEHSTRVLSSIMAKTHPIIYNNGDYDQSYQEITSKCSGVKYQDLKTKDPTVNTAIPTFISCGIEHDEPLDPMIVQRLQNRLNTGSTNSDAEGAAFGNVLSQKQLICSEPNEVKLTGREKTREDEYSLTTNGKGRKTAFLCQVCGKLLHGRSNLKSHLLTHSSARPHVCHVCNKAFRRRHTFNIHIRTHTNENPYTCGSCPAAFKTRSNLVRHAAVHTTRSRDYCCQECGKEFTSKLSLNGHRKIHAAKRPCVCSQCGAVYATMQSLRTHELHHKYPDKQFKCKLCDKAYVFQSLLKRHMEGHNGVQKFHCHLCSATFAWKSSLAAHIQTHYPKKFKCKLCSLSFNIEKRFVSHLKKHSEPKPHCCTLCLKRFPFRYLLVRHVKSAHGHKSFVTVKTKTAPKRTDVVRRFPHPSSGRRNRVKLQARTSNEGTSEMGAASNSHKSFKQVTFPTHSAVIPKMSMYRFRCVSANGEPLLSSVPRFTVSIGQEIESSVVTHSNIVKQEHDQENISRDLDAAEENLDVVADSLVSDSINVGNDCCEKQSAVSRAANSYREPPPSYFSASPHGFEAFVDGPSNSPNFFQHSSTAKSTPRPADHVPSSNAHDSYTPSYETFSSLKTFSDLKSSPGLGRYQRSRGPAHPNLLPASSDPYLHAASSVHSAYFPSPPQQATYDSPSARHQPTCGSTHQASFNLQPAYGPSPPSQQPQGLQYLATHSDYDLAGCLEDKTLPDEEPT